MAGGTVRAHANFRLRSIEWSNEVTMKEVGNRIAVRVVNRTLSGLDEDGAPFAPYKAHKGKGRWGKGPSDPVTLHDTGAMLANLGPVDVTQRSVRIGFSDPAQEAKARAHDSGVPRRGLPQRRFLGVPEDWVKEIIEFVWNKVDWARGQITRTS